MSNFLPGDLAYLPERAILYDEQLHYSGRVEKPELVIVLDNFEKDAGIKRNLLKILSSKKSFFVRKNDLKKAIEVNSKENKSVSKTS